VQGNRGVPALQEIFRENGRLLPCEWRQWQRRNERAARWLFQLEGDRDYDLRFDRSAAQCGGTVVPLTDRT
jgi:hypothetical protein